MAKNVDFNTLTPNERGKLIRTWITDKTGPNRLINGTTIYQLNNETININANIPTVNEIELFFSDLVKDGRAVDPLFNNIITVDDNSLAGMYAVQDDESELLLATRAGTSSYEAKRKLGYTQEEVKNNIIQKAVGTPKLYLADKYKDIENINNRAYEAWQKAYAKYRDFGYDEETAFNKAKTAADSFKAQLMKEHETEYPDKLTADAKSRIGDR